MRTYTNLKNNETIVAKFETDKAVKVLREKRKSSDFAQSLCAKWEFWVDRKLTELSQTQLYWIHKMSIDATTPRKADVAFSDVDKLIGYFDNAKERLEYPKMVLQFGAEPIRLSMAGDKSKYEGDIHFAHKNNGFYYGRLSRDGKFYRGKDCDGLVFDWVKKILNDIDCEILTFGKESGFCCFCYKKLTDTKSRAVGYGKVCSENWGLDWGKKQVTKGEVYDKS